LVWKVWFTGSQPSHHMGPNILDFNERIVA
jgi:hypothetical protein